MKKLVIFDIDRTIYDGSVFLDFSLHLVQKNLISPKILSSLGFEFVTYQTGFESYDELVRDCLNYFFEEVKNIQPDIIKKEFKECLFKNHHKFYDYVFKTINNYPEYEYLLISLEPDFIVKEIASFLRIENYLANKFLNNGEYLDKPELVFNKYYLLENSKFTGIKPFSVFGDSESDLPLLELAQNKFVINPTTILYKQISSSDYHILNHETIFDEVKKIF